MHRSSLNGLAIVRLPVRSYLSADYLLRGQKEDLINIRQPRPRRARVYNVCSPQLAPSSEFQGLKTIPGVGDILAETIVLETGEVKRFKGPGNFASYCRCVDSRRESNGKKKGENNRKNGNRYLAWAFIEAANFAIRRSAKAKSYWIMRNGTSYDEARLFA